MIGRLLVSLSLVSMFVPRLRPVLKQFPIVCLAILWWAALVGQGSQAWGEEPQGDDRLREEFFENQVRPLLVASCVECHEGSDPSGGLRLDTRDGVLRGGERGPALAVGDAEQSLLIEAVRRTGELKMPPDETLTDAQIETLRQWIAAGAVWPATQTLSDETKIAAQRDHWAFQPVVPPNVPTVQHNDWCRNPIDRFVLARLESHALRPSPSADRRTLIRRATYDLTGLPPHPDAVAAFVADADEQAYERLIDDLLESPHYGEHWARHWLDVARYSDTKGYVYDREERFFVHSATYRDWVADAFHRDLPYDRFLMLQIAADQISPDDPHNLAAMGFLTLGRRFLGVTHDIIDDRIDVVSRGTMALTVGCARCHDHKYDPIPTADYYSLYGVFQNATERQVAIDAAAGDEAFQRELQAKQDKLSEELAKQRAEAANRARTRIADYLLAQLELHKIPEEGFDQILSPDDLFPAFVRRWESYLARMAHQDHPAFRIWHQLFPLADERFEALAADRLAMLRAQSDKAGNQRVLRQFESTPASRHEMVLRYAQLLLDVDQQWQQLVREAEASGTAAPTKLPHADDEELRQVLYGATGPCQVPDEAIVSTESFFPTSVCEAIWRLQGEVDRWILQSPHEARYAVALFDRSSIQEPRIFRRGNPATKGDRVTRQFLLAVAGTDREPFQHGSGRRELAAAIVDPRNPLTARVWVNRVWMHHFEQGLVNTPSDFGLRAEAPSHPELLDWLADRLVTDGWSTKRLHRLIMLSAAYQQSSSGPDDAAVLRHAQQVDPENRLLWRMNPHRLTFEEMRDTLLAVSGRLDRQHQGRATDLFNGDHRRRTIYGTVDRQFLPNVHRMFDFANPDLHVPQRSETTVPQQALFALNHSLVAQCARALAAEAVKEQTDDVNEQRIERMFWLALQRQPAADEMAQALEFVSEPAARITAASITAASDTVADAENPELPHLDVWEQLAQVLLLSNELSFVD
jgi:cytochrome c553